MASKEQDAAAAKEAIHPPKPARPETVEGQVGDDPDAHTTDEDLTFQAVTKNDPYVDDGDGETVPEQQPNVLTGDGGDVHAIDRQGTGAVHGEPQKPAEEKQP